MGLKPFSRLIRSWAGLMHFHIHHNGDSSLPIEPSIEKFSQEFNTISCRLLSILCDFATLLKCHSLPDSLNLFNIYNFNDLGSLYVFGVPSILAIATRAFYCCLLSNARKNLHKCFWLPGNQRFLSVQNITVAPLRSKQIATCWLVHCNVLFSKYWVQSKRIVSV